MTRKLTIEECQEYAKSKEGKCLSETYINGKTKMKWVCKEKHQWISVFNNIKSGRWCPVCAGKEKLTIDECKEYAKSKKGKCLSETYININTKMKWECKEKHQWVAVFNSIKSGHWCPVCGGSEKLSIDECQEYALSKEGKCLSKTYINAHTKMKWECKEKHQWVAIFNSIKSGHWCHVCGGNQKLTIDECKEYAKSKEGKCLSETYVNAITKMKWECKEKHQWVAIFNAIKSGHWCPACGGNEKLTIDECQEYAKSKEGKCLSETYINIDTKMKWECKNNHQWKATFSSIKHKYRWCQKCRLCPMCEQYITDGELCMATCHPSVRNKNTKKARTKSKEWGVVYYLREKLDQEFIHNQSVGTECTLNDRENTNGHLYPDIRFDCNFYHLIVEVDEHQHRGADYSCDNRRMHDIIAKLGLPCIFIRYNPDSKDSNNEVLLEKIKTYLNLGKKYITYVNEYGFKAEYLYYN